MTMSLHRTAHTSIDQLVIKGRVVLDESAKKLSESTENTKMSDFGSEGCAAIDEFSIIKSEHCTSCNFSQLLWNQTHNGGNALKGRIYFGWLQNKPVFHDTPLWRQELTALTFMETAIDSEALSFRFGTRSSALVIGVTRNCK